MEASELVQISFTLQINKGKLDASAQVPTAPVQMRQMLPVLQELSNNIIGAVVANVTSDGYQISCKAGCGACCRQMVPVSLFEADNLAAWIRSLPSDQQLILEARFRAALAALEKKGILEQLNFAQWPQENSEELRPLMLKYFHAGVACPFLLNESCGIHPIRPLVCREYLVTSPAEFCADPKEDTVRVVPMPVKLSTALSKLSEPLTSERRGWIPLVFIFAWMKSDFSVAGALEMPGPEMLRTIVNELTTAQSDLEASTQSSA